MNAYEPYVSLALALGVGLLIGIQREQSAHAEGRGEQEFLGGVRTHPLYALSGAVAALLARQWGLWVLLLPFGLLAVLLSLAYADDLRKGRDRGITSEVAFLISFLLGTLAMSNQVVTDTQERLFLVSSLAVVVTGLLSLKEPLHRLVARISRQDIYATLKFLVLAVIVLPLLPNRAMGPWEALNPYHIGLMIVLIAGMSFLGYLAIQFWGPGKGMGMTGLLGGMVSSTAVTLTFSGRARNEPALARSCALAVVLASSIMIVRVLAEVAIVNHDLLALVLYPLLPMLATGLIASAILYRKSSQTSHEPQKLELSNPFEFGNAVKFGLLFGAVLLATKAAQIYLGSGGMYLAAVLSGLHDLDAITLSMSKMAQQGLSREVAALSILLACLANTAVKAALACFLGGWAFGRRVSMVFALVILSGLAGLAVLQLSS